MVVVFIEFVNVYFKGVDFIKCIVKIIGDMIMLFLSGIIKVFISNFILVVLCFRVKNISRLE